MRIAGNRVANFRKVELGGGLQFGRVGIVQKPPQNMLTCCFYTPVWKSSSVSLVNCFTAIDAVQPLWLSGNANGKINILSILSPVKSSYTFLNSAWHNTNLCLQSSFVHIFIRDTKKSWSDSMTKNEIRNWVPGMRDPDRKNCKVSHIFLPSDHSGYRVCQELNWPHLPYEVKITPFTKLARILKW